MTHHDVISCRYDNSRVLCYALLPAEHPADVPVKFIFTGKAKPGKIPNSFPFEERKEREEDSVFFRFCFLGTAAKDFSVSVSANLSAAVSGFRLHALYGYARWFVIMTISDVISSPFSFSSLFLICWCWWWRMLMTNDDVIISKAHIRELEQSGAAARQQQQQQQKTSDAKESETSGTAKNK